MRTIITIEEMQEINQILLTTSSASQFVNPWPITIPGELDFWNKPRPNPELDKSNQFIHDLFIYFKPNKLSAYKKIFDFTFEKNIDLLKCFDNVSFKGLGGDPDLFELFHYSYTKKYYQPDHDFSIYFNIIEKPNQANILEQMKLLPALDHSQSSFDIFCKLFDSYLKVVPYPDTTAQAHIEKLFKKFEHQDFYISQSSSHQKFYPSLLNVSQISQLQEDDYFSKRFCFSANHPVSTLAQNIDNNLHYIYNVVFQDLKEKDLVADYNYLSEQGYFYLYVFTKEQSTLKQLGKSINNFHQQLQPFLQNNTEKENYYIKLFQTVCLAEKLASKERTVTEVTSSVKPKKI